MRGPAAILPPAGATYASFVLFASLAALLGMAYASAEWLHGGFGFPSDEAWARAVFARNVVAGQGLCFNPGVAVAGAAGPAWVASLAATGVVTGNFFLGAKVLGVLCVILAAFGAWYLTLDLLGDWRFAFLAGLLVAASPRLAAAGLSGTEAALAALLVIAAIHWQARGWEGTVGQRAAAAAAAALAALCRPELVLLLPVLVIDRWIVAARSVGGREKRRIGRALAGSLPELAAAAVIMAPYVIYNWRTGGPLWQQPETALRAQPAWVWAGALVRGLGADNGLLLCAAAVGLPVAGLAAARAHSEHRSFALVLAPLVIAAVPGLIWGQATAESAVYAAAYLTPVIAVLAASGFFLAHRLGTRRLRPESGGGGRIWFGVMIGVVCAGITVLTLLAHRTSWQQHGVEVKKVSGLQVWIGKWAADHLAPDASIASREVGAIGFFSHKRMVDLGGTISKEGLDYLSRPGAPDTNLLEFLREEQPSHLAIRPGDFPDLAQRGDLLAPAATCVVTDPTTGGTTAMTLYETPWPPASIRAAREALRRK